MNPEVQPLVSILCLSMNHEKYVEQAFISVIKQTYKNLEIIYLDNNSTDKTFEIANQLFLNSGLPYKGFKREKNYSIPENMNFLIKAASGKYIAPHSGDDWWDLTNIEEKIEYFENHPEYGLLYSNGYYYFEQTNKYLIPPDIDRFKSGFIFDDLFLNGIYFPTGIVVRRDVFDIIGYYDEELVVDDWDMWLKISKHFAVGYFEKPLVYYRRHSSSFCTEIEGNHGEYLKIIDKYKTHPLYTLATERLTRNYISRTATYNPGWKALKTIKSYYRFNWFYNKQLIKALLIIFKLYKPRI